MKTNKTNLTAIARHQKRYSRKAPKQAKVVSMACKKFHSA